MCRFLKVFINMANRNLDAFLVILIEVLGLWTNRLLLTSHRLFFQVLFRLTNRDGDTLFLSQVEVLSLLALGNGLAYVLLLDQVEALETDGDVLALLGGAVEETVVGTLGHRQALHGAVLQELVDRALRDRLALL